jgi:hypothetical protein
MDYDELPRRTDANPDFIITIGPATAMQPRLAIDAFDGADCMWPAWDSD